MPPPRKPAVAAISIDEDAIRAMLTAAVSDAVDDRLAELKATLYEIRTALTGNGFGANHGLIYRVGEVEKNLVALQGEFHAERQERRDAAAKVKYTAMGVGIGAGLGGGGLVLAIVKLFGV